MKLTVIFVGPEYEKNIGYVCRVMGNFGYKELVIIKPKCKIGEDAIKYSKHGIEILNNAKIKTNFFKEIKKYDFVIGSSGIRMRNRDTIRDVLPLKQFVKNLDYYKWKKVALVIGREGIGLNKHEISACDLIITIETGKYATLNVSHALAVLLYEISNRKVISGEIPIEKKEKNALMGLFSKMTKDSKNPKLAITCFRRILGRSRIKKKEAIQLLEVFRNKL